MNGTAEVFGIILFEYEWLFEVEFSQSAAETVEMFFGVAVNFIIFWVDNLWEQIGGQVLIAISHKCGDINVDFFDKLGLVFCQDIVDLDWLWGVGHVFQ